MSLIKNFFKKEVKTVNKIPTNSEVSKTIFKGQVPLKTVRFPAELGEEHPYDFSSTEGLYKKFGFVTGVIDKYVDFIVGPGFYVTSEDKRAQKIIEEFLQDINFDTLLRAWVKEGLIKGNGFLEIGGKNGEIPQGMKVLDANYMFLRRDKFGNILNYAQYKGAFDKFEKEKTVEFENHQIAHIALNKVGNDAYGIGIVYPALNTVNNLLQNEKDMHLILSRKANTPIVAKIGDIDNPVTADAITSFGKELEWLNNKHEWAVPYYVDLKAIDFGKVGEKFEGVNKYDLDMLFFTFQVPEVLMGRGSIPEGLAQVQLEAFDRRVQSLQAEIEKVVEQQIFKRVLNANGFDEHVEMEWGQPSKSETIKKVEQLTELLKLFDLNPKLRNEIEKQLAELLGIEPKTIEMKNREREERQQLPRIPGSRENIPPLNIPSHSCTNVTSTKSSGDDKDYSLHEWLGFNYQTYLENIKKFIRSEQFVNRPEHRAYRHTIQDDQEAILQYYGDSYKLTEIMSSEQINALRDVLIKGFDEGKSIQWITKKIVEKVRPGDLEINVPPQLDSEGNIIREGYSRVLNEKIRSNMMARTESSRAANQATLQHFNDTGIKLAVWIAGLDDRTCPTCLAMNGNIFEVQAIEEMLPAHLNCRCKYAAFTEYNLR